MKKMVLQKRPLSTQKKQNNGFSTIYNDVKKKFMKDREKIYADYLKYYKGKIPFFLRETHWKIYYDAYKFGYEEAIEENKKNWYKTLGIDLSKYPLDVDKQFEVMRKALQNYYKNQEN